MSTEKVCTCTDEGNGLTAQDPWCPLHARCGACGGEVIIILDDPAFCPSCGCDVMPARACHFITEATS